MAPIWVCARLGEDQDGRRPRLGYALARAAVSAPDDQPDACGGSVAERHRLGAVGVHGSPMGQ